MSSSPTEQGPTANQGTVEVTLPDLGPHVLEAIVVGWEKHPGEWVEREEPICIVSADGLRAAIGSSASGYLVRLLAGVGVRIGPGTSLAEIATADIDSGPTVQKPEGEPVVVVETPSGPPPASRTEPEPEPETETEPATEREPLAELEQVFSPPGDRRPERPPQSESLEMSSFHSPAVKRLADQHGIDLAFVAGTGAGGRVRKEDVLAHVETLPSPLGDESITEDAQGAGAPER